MEIKYFKCPVCKNICDKAGRLSKTDNRMVFYCKRCGWRGTE